MLGLLPSVATSQVRIFLYAKDVDMRKSFDALYGIVQTEFKKDVRLGDLFLFLNRRLDRIKLIYWDRDGLAIWMKRLEQGTFQRPVVKDDPNQVEIDATELALLLSGIDLRTAKRRKRYAIDSDTRGLIEESLSK
jgi:transposase